MPEEPTAGQPPADSQSGSAGPESGGPENAAPVGPPPAAPRRSTSLRPALLVGGLAVVIIAAFATIGAIGSGHAQTPPAKAATGVVQGSGLTSEPAATSLAPIISSGEPPRNIVRSITVPVQATRTSVQARSFQTDQYDRSVHYQIAASQGAVVGFYRADLHRLGWRIVSAGPAQTGQGVEVLAQKGGDDGWYWEIGVVVRPTTFTHSGASPPTGGAPGPSSAAAKRGETTRFSLELLQEPDSD